ncbi:cupin domain-containing protein [Leekyejoonella antrihumi]|uniref:Cupin domain-containing protein n=1 Tax=Leekyejoonella antrihumi TaxID=1660198 RepID=A0A563DXM2_9MICO|nr:cupin domain-containing protein [Leekyejoonella antrihumi]TWP34966.1 cupin domain-containing protein [Leekyejoonella antrihumi]
MELMTRQDAPVHATHGTNSPSIEVLFGGKRDSEEIGLVRLTVPAGVSMPSHRHAGSDVILAAVAGSVRITKGDQIVDLEVGDALLIFKYESVALANPHQQTAEVLVAAGPAAFISTVRRWPKLDTRVPSSA